MVPQLLLSIIVLRFDADAGGISNAMPASYARGATTGGCASELTGNGCVVVVLSLAVAPLCLAWR